MATEVTIEYDDIPTCPHGVMAGRCYACIPPTVGELVAAAREEARRDDVEMGFAGGLLRSLADALEQANINAERYLRLRNRDKDMSVHIAVLTHNGGYCPTGDECDAAVDAARGKHGD